MTDKLCVGKEDTLEEGSAESHDCPEQRVSFPSEHACVALNRTKKKQQQYSRI